MVRIQANHSLVTSQFTLFQRQQHILYSINPIVTGSFFFFFSQGEVNITASMGDCWAACFKQEEIEMLHNQDSDTELQVSSSIKMSLTLELQVHSLFIMSLLLETYFLLVLI
jgi:hypothetical protein